MRSEEEARPGNGYTAPVAPVRGPAGRRMPRSGWIALAMLVVAAGSFLAGTRLAGSAPLPVPTAGAPSPGHAGASGPPSPSAPPSMSSSAVPITTSAVPPIASGASLDRALATARSAFLGPSPQIVAAQVVQYKDVSRASLASPEAWVWAFTARGRFSFASCAGPTAAGGRTAPPSQCPSPATTARVIVDFRTGAFIEADVPATP